MNSPTYTTRRGEIEHYFDRTAVAAWERLTITMALTEIAEGNRRAAAFVARKPANPQTS